MLDKHTSFSFSPASKASKSPYTSSYRSTSSMSTVKALRPPSSGANVDKCKMQTIVGLHTYS